MNLIKSLQQFKIRTLSQLLRDIFWPGSAQHLQHPDLNIRKKCLKMQRHFKGAWAFMHKRTTLRQGKKRRLCHLPWILLIGPAHAGKTTLLANSKVPYILKRQAPITKPLPSESTTQNKNCDWWITSRACIIDVPGHYTFLLWQFFLRLIKKQRGTKGINSIIISLPLPQLLQHSDPKKLQAILQHLFQRLLEVERLFKMPIPCQLMITKCDLLPGFNEFFAETDHEQIDEIVGINLPYAANKKAAETSLIEQFNELIKKLNQQLIWRLHQEHNPMLRPYIKDFPLQVERIKNIALEFIKRLHSSTPNLSLQGIYLSSALQPEPAPSVIEPFNHQERALQHLKAPKKTSTAYFIKQWLNHTLMNADVAVKKIPFLNKSNWKNISVYFTALLAISSVALMLGSDFRQGIQKSQDLEQQFSKYEHSLPVTGDAKEQLLKLLPLLNTLQQSASGTQSGFHVFDLLTFYSKKAKQKAALAYQETLKSLFVPALHACLAEYLKLPVNKNPETLYAALSAYLMLPDKNHFEADAIMRSIEEMLPKDYAALLPHLRAALHFRLQNLALDQALIQQTRQYFYFLPPVNRALIILKNTHNNNKKIPLLLLNAEQKISAFNSQNLIPFVPALFTAAAFPTIAAEEIKLAADESLMGNWVLGEHNPISKTAELLPVLRQQLSNTYLNDYIALWEHVLNTVEVYTPQTLLEADTMLAELVSDHSPLLQLLKTVHDNTYFEPIMSNSAKLQSINTLLEKNNVSEQLLYQVFAALNGLHQYLQVVTKAENEDQAAFAAISNRMLHQQTPDVITQLLIVANKVPAPLKMWLDKIANDSVHLLMQNASHYLDTAWQTKVMPLYQAEIAHHYPFDPESKNDVKISEFIRFFGRSGVAMQFYEHYLYPLVDTSTPEWQWKKIEGRALPFSEETLHQVQHAMHIHQAFFPHHDDTIALQFNLRPYQLSHEIKQVSVAIDDKQFIDEHEAFKSSSTAKNHVVIWPNPHAASTTSIQLALHNHQLLQQHFSGEWGWFKLVNQSFESLVSKKEMVINLSSGPFSAKYLLFTDGQFNPFISLNLRHFQLSRSILSSSLETGNFA
jgi:type VI secretion system protein ImpL